MGKIGTEVAKEAADILLLDDEFANILKGVKSGRTIFDTFKKFTCYNLTNNCFELLMFLSFIILQIPLPMTTILILCIDVCANVYPNIAFATEPPEKKIMLKKPRNAKTDHICTLRLFNYAYLFTGIMDACGGFLTYFVILNNFGLTPDNILGVVQRKGIYPSANDVYNPVYDEYSGNSDAFLYHNYDRLGIYDGSTSGGKNGLSQYLTIFDATSDRDLTLDLKLFFYNYPASYWGKCLWDHVNSKGKTICWTFETVRYAQGGVWLAALIGVVGWGIHFRAIHTSAFTHEFTNLNMNLAYFVQLGICFIVLYIPGLNIAFGVRPIHAQEIFPACAFWISGFLLEEFRKYLVRSIREPNDSPGYCFRYFYY